MVVAAAAMYAALATWDGRWMPRPPCLVGMLMRVVLWGTAVMSVVCAGNTGHGEGELCVHGFGDIVDDG